MNTKTRNANDKATHGLIYDPIPFAGGSKIATLEMLMTTHESIEKQADDNVSFTIVTADPDSWRTAVSKLNARIITLPNWGFLTVPQGVRYWVAQLVLALILMATVIRLPRISYSVGASNPGIDMALYIVKWVWRMPIIQLVHGPVGLSRSIGYCFTRADSIFYLSSSIDSIRAAISCYFSKAHDSKQAEIMTRAVLESARFESFTNGLTQANWPTQSTGTSSDVFWAASLLKWKGLETLNEALDITNQATPWNTNICYITPQNTHLGVSSLPTESTYTKLFHAPNNLDQIRASSGIFVSTSINEPFGLSVLESLAAGLCVVIPSDGAYWDRVLEDNVNCLKFAPQDPQSLYEAVQTLIDEPQLRQRLSQASLDIAKQYRAEHCYASICITMRRKAQTKPAMTSLETSHD